MERKLGEFKAENELLGRLLQEAQSERRSLEGHLAKALADSERQRQLLGSCLEAKEALELQLQHLRLEAEERDEQLAR